LVVWLVGWFVTTTAARAGAETRPFYLYMLTNPPMSPSAIIGMRVGMDDSLTALPGSPFLTGGNGLASPVGAEYAHRIAISWSGNRLFAANDQHGSIAVFDIAPLTGVLSAVPGSPFLVPGWANVGGTSLAISANGQLLYASNGGAVVSFQVDAAGALTRVGGQFTFTSRINGTAISDANDFLYLALPDRVTAIKTGPSGIAGLTPINLSIGASPTDVAINRAGNVLQVGTKNGGIHAFRFNGTSFTPIAGTPFLSSTTHLSGLAPDFYEHVLGVYGALVPRAASLLVTGDGALMPGANSPLSPSIIPTGGTLSPDGRRLFLSNNAAELDAWRIDGAGTMTHAPSYPTSIGASAGFSKLVAFPDKTPTPTPALPVSAVLLLAGCLFAAVAARRRLRAQRCD
jgi:hypothetical protein